MTIGAGLAPVDADVSLTPFRPNSGRLQLLVRFGGDFHQPAEEPFPISVLEPHLFRCVLYKIRQCGAAMGVTEIYQDVRGRYTDGLAN